MARTPMNERTDISGEAACGIAEHKRRIREKPAVSIPHKQSISSSLSSPPPAILPPFFLLPTEIRLFIYTLSISQPNNEFPILYNGTSFFYVRTIDVSESSIDFERIGYWIETPPSLCPFYGWPLIAPAIYKWSLEFWGADGGGKQFPSYQPSKRGRGTILTLLQSCKNIYRELLPHILTTYKFSFCNALALMDFSLAIPHSHFSQIHHLRLQLQCPNRRVEKSFNDEAAQHTHSQIQTTTEQTCTLLSTLPNLQALHITWAGYPGSHRRRIELLLPLLLVKQLSKEKFVVHAPWDWVPSPEDFGLGAEELPFLVEAGEEGDWVEDYRFTFSPDDHLGVDLEGWNV